MSNVKTLYNTAKSAKVGDLCTCPSCGAQFKKASYQQAFCKTKGGTVCKDKYWNTVDPSKRNNTTRISPANAAWMRQQARERESFRSGYGADDDHPFSSSGLGQWDD